VTGTAAKYLLTGIARCGVCGGGLTVRSRDHGKERAFRYVCATFHYRGKAICGNTLEMWQPYAEAKVVDFLKDEILRPAVIERAVQLTIEALNANRPADAAERTRRALARAAQEIGRYVQALAHGGGDVAPLVDALRASEAERRRLRAELAAVEGPPSDRGAANRSTRALASG